ncbi:hypothetical protein EZV62_011799 [Acer yangbiense]|uniref:Uncharacterized protein n=1 Tax=Acer yangbiense TaxID=1000413 RepID=A0A5C7I6Q2_9ROSI|nr:hypothetical protein EZV62_011799 [Acer yangbiense]
MQNSTILDTISLVKLFSGTNAVQGIVLDMSKIKDMCLSSEAFKKMYNLRLLKFYNPTWIKEHFVGFNSSHSPYHSKVHFGEGLSDISDKLRSLIWLGYPLPTLPSNFNPNNLVELDLRCSNVERLWEGTMHVPKLKRLFLRHCTRLTKIPDLSESPLIEEIDIRYCSSLLDFPQLAQHGNNLCDLSMWGCKSLRSFPSDIRIESFEFLVLRGCNNITKFPEISGNITYLDLSWTAIDEVPPSILCLTKLCNLNLSHCTRLQHIPTSICKLKFLYELNLENCSGLESFPEILDTMEHLKTLELSGTSIKELPENLGNLKSLIYLSADRSAISQLPSSMKHLKNLKKLSCRGCRGLRFTPSSGLPCSLTSLYLSDCNLKEIPEDICCLSSLLHLDLSDNHFEHLPKSMKQLCDLIYLNLNNCNMLQSLTELPPRLQHLSAIDCERLRSIPDASEFAEIIRNASEYSERIRNASEFAEIISNGCFSEFIFSNCLNLEAAVGDMFALLITYLNKVITLLINLFLSLSLTLKIIMIFMLQETDCYSFCYSGSEVPRWFIYRTEGSSIEFGVAERHDQFFSDQLLGFAVCAVIAFEEYCYVGDSEDQLDFGNDVFGEEDFGEQLDVRYKFISNNEECYDDRIVVAYTNKTLIDSDHVVLEFLPYPLDWELPGEMTNCACEFSLSKTSPNYRVKYCGVCPIYANQNIGETSGKRSRTSNDHQEEEVEPQGDVYFNLDFVAV